MNRQHASSGGSDSNEASPLALLVHAADAQHQRPSSKRPTNGSGGASRGKSHGAPGNSNSLMHRELHESALEEQLMQRQVAAARAEAALQQQQGLLPHLPRGIEELYQQSSLAAAAQQQQQHAAAMAMASDLRTAVAAAQLRQAAQFQNHDLLLARAAQQQLGGFGGGAIEQLQELELQRLEEMERRHILAQVAGGHIAPQIGSQALGGRQLELPEQLRTEQVDRMHREQLFDRVGGRGASESASADGGTASSSEKDTFQKTPGSVVVPCRARGMPMDHNFKTAYFVIPENVEHGEELICSYFACRNAGIKFRYCTYCKVPVAKRNFRKRHRHGFAEKGANDADEDSQSGDERESPAPASSDVKPEVPTSEEVEKVDEEPAVAPKETDEADHAAVAGAENEPREPSPKPKASDETAPEDAEKPEPAEASKPEGPSTARNSESTTSDEAKDQDSGSIDDERKRRWAKLLAKRPPTKDGGAMSGWLMEVLAVSDLETPLNEKGPVAPPQTDSVEAPVEPDKSSAATDKADDAKTSDLPSEGVLIKKKRSLSVLMHTDDTGDSEDQPENDAGGGFAEWKDRKKQKGLMKKGLSG